MTPDSFLGSQRGRLSKNLINLGRRFSLLTEDGFEFGPRRMGDFLGKI